MSNNSNGPIVTVPDLKDLKENYIYNLFCRNGERLDITAFDRKKLAEKLVLNSK